VLPVMEGLPADIVVEMVAAIEIRTACADARAERGSMGEGRGAARESGPWGLRCNRVWRSPTSLAERILHQWARFLGRT
jgi:hypothetical protein